MTITLASDNAATALPVWTATGGDLDGLPETAKLWAGATRFEAAAGQVLLVPGAEGTVAGAVLGLGKATGTGEGGAQRRALVAGALATRLPAGDWRLADATGLDNSLTALAVLLGGYRFDRYRTGPKPEDGTSDIRLAVPDGADADEIRALADGVALTRDLINTPTNDMGPAELEAAARKLGDAFGATVSTIEGDALLAENLPMIHAVGRASASAPRLIDMVWGPADAPKVTLVGKGVCFDTG
ncbi:MAG: leucyl aminopeptidase family protein, partial [Paracoccus sp. (in: a-proteobacteria)]